MPMQIFCIELGQGVVSESNNFVQVCLTGGRVYAGSSESDLSLVSEDGDHNKVMSAFGEVSASIGNNLFGVSGACSIDIKHKKHEHHLKFSHNFSVSYQTELLTNLRWSETGKKAYRSVPLRYQDRYWLWPGFQKICGDSFVHSVRKGGGVEFQVVVFSDKVITNLEAVKKIAVKVLFAKRTKTVKDSYTTLQAHDGIYVSATQYGGRPEVFASQFKEAAFCEAGNPENCRNRIAEIFSYVSEDGEAGFKSQIRENPAIIHREVQKYQDLGFVLD